MTGRSRQQWGEKFYKLLLCIMITTKILSLCWADCVPGRPSRHVHGHCVSSRLLLFFPLHCISFWETYSWVTAPHRGTAGGPHPPQELQLEVWLGSSELPSTLRRELSTATLALVEVDMMLLLLGTDTQRDHAVVPPPDNSTLRSLGKGIVQRCLNSFLMTVIWMKMSIFFFLTNRIIICIIVCNECSSNKCLGIVQSLNGSIVTLFSNSISW